MSEPSTEAASPELQELVQQLESNISAVVLGKAEVVRMCLVGLLSSEHVLVEDVPGVGLAVRLGWSFDLGPGEE